MDSDRVGTYLARVGMLGGGGLIVIGAFSINLWVGLGVVCFLMMLLGLCMMDT